MDNLHIIIPVAGIGHRMKTLGPKCSITIDGKSILERQLDILQEVYPKANITIVSGFKKERTQKLLEDWRCNRVLGSNDIKIVFNPDFSKTNVAYSIALAAIAMKADRYLVVYGDLVFNKKTFTELDLSNKRQTGLLVNEKSDADYDEVGVIVKNNTYVEHMSYEYENKWAQIALLTGNEIKHFCDISTNKKYERYFGFEVFNMMVRDGSSLRAYYNDDMRVVDIDNKDDILDARQIVQLEKAVVPCV